MQHTRESKNNGGRIPYGPKSILSAGQNKFRTRFNPISFRPSYRNLLQIGTTKDGKGRYLNTDAGIERLEPQRPWRGKSERRRVIKQRRQAEAN